MTSLDETKVRSGSQLFVVLGKPEDARRELRLRLQFAGTFNPGMLDIEIKDEAGGEARSGKVKVEPGATLNLSVTGEPFAERNTTLVISGSLDGAPLFTTRVPYTAVHAASFAMFEHIYRLKESRRRGGCADRQCFLTTACCGIIGLDDDCFELRSLRAFRDRALPSLPGGRRDVAEYYVLAPVILDAMQRTGSQRVLLRYYVSHILPCAVLARLGLNVATQRLYRDLMRRLLAAYTPGAAPQPVW
jgi:hypothetical protein